LRRTKKESDEKGLEIVGGNDGLNPWWRELPIYQKKKKPGSFRGGGVNLQSFRLGRRGGGGDFIEPNDWESQENSPWG